MYTLYNNSASPYGLKVLALLGYSGVACRVMTQNIVTRFTVIRRLTGRTMIPVLRDGELAVSDSTQIARKIMGESVRPMLPRDPGRVELCWLLEDFADEWMALFLLYSRWHTEKDSEEVSQIVGQEMGAGLPWISQGLGALSGRVIPKAVQAMGVRESNAEALEQSRERMLLALEVLFGEGPLYLLEGYPTVADFAFFGVLGQYFRDPAGRVRVKEFPRLQEYLGRLEAMCLPLAEIQVNWEQAPREMQSLQPVFAELMGTYWPLLVANFRAFSDLSKQDSTRRTGRKHGKGRRKQAQTMMIDGSTFYFAPSGGLTRRFQELLRLIDQAYQQRDALFGGEGLRLESALLSQIAALSRHPEGRELLREYPHLGLH